MTPRAPTASSLRWIGTFIGPLLLLIFLLPYLCGVSGAFSGEAALLSYPQQLFLSRLLRAGHYPWFDPAVGAGAVDWSVRLSHAALYPPNWPFLLLGSGSAFADYPALYLFPLAAHLLLSCLFAFALARRGLRLDPAPALLLSLSWSLSPVFALQTGRLPAIFSLAWLPAAALFLLLFSREGGRGRLLAAAGAAALSSLGGDLAAAAGVFLSIAVFGLALVLAFLRRADRLAARRALGGAFAALVLGGCLSGIRWAGLPESLRLVREAELAAPPPPVFPLSPAALAGFLVPGIFGADTGHGLWGPALALGRRWPSVALPGGIASALLVASGLISIRRRRGAVAPARTCPDIPILQSNSRVGGAGLPGAAAGVAIFCFLAGALLAFLAPDRILGSSPPVLLAFSWSLLLGLSFQSLRGHPEAVSPSRIGKILAVFAGIVLFALFWPYRSALGLVFPGLRGLAAVAVSGLLLALFAGLAAAGAFFAAVRFLPLRFRPSAVLLLALLEIALGAYRGFYRSAAPAFPPGDLFGARYRGPSDHPAYRAAASFAAAFPDLENRYRRGYFRSAFDNLAWAFGSASPLGFELGPVGRRAATAFSGAADRSGGELVPRDWASNFWRNLSVRYLLSAAPLAPPAQPIPAGPGRCYAGLLPEPLPRWYFQDRWVVADEERERFALLNFDLRAAGYCPREVWHVRPFAHLYPHPPPLSDAEWKAHFDDLQESNRILSVDETDPHRLVFRMEVKKLSMLVVTDLHHPGWKVRVDERAKDVHRVNYLQRGVWCRPGSREIVMEFLPPSLGPGLAWTAAGLIGVIMVLSLPGRRNRLDRGVGPQ